MPVQIPQLKEMSPVDTPSLGRIENDVPDLVHPMEQTQKAVERVGEQVKTFAEHQEDYAINNKAAALANDYEQKYRGALAEARKTQGDPTEVFQKLRQDARQWQDEALSNLPQNGIDPAANRLANTVRDHMARVDYRVGDAASVAEATLAAGYNEKVNQAGIQLDQNAIATDATALVRAGDPTSLNAIAGGIDQLQARHLQHGLAVGLATEHTGENGVKSYVASDILKETIKKDTSSALLTSIRSLNASGLIDESKMVMDRFGDQLTASDRLKLLGETKGAQNDVEASKIWAKYQNDDNWFDKISAANIDPQIKEKVLSKGDTYHRIMDHNSKRVADEAFSDATDYLQGLQDKGQPILTVDQLRTDSNLQAFRNRMLGKPKLWESLEASIEKPKVSNTKALSNFFGTIADGSLKDKTPQEIAEMKIGLDTRHQTMLDQQYVKATQDTNGERSAALRDISGQIKQQLSLAGVISPAIINNKYDGRYSEQQNEYNAVLQQVYNNFDTLPKNAPPDVRNKWAKQIVGAYIKDKAFTPESFKAGLGNTFQTAPKPPTYLAPPAQPKTITPAAALPTAGDQMAALKAFKDAKGRPWSSKTDTVKDLQPYFPKGN